MTDPSEQLDQLVGHHVVVTNPNLSSEWRGVCIAGSVDPVVLVEFDGHRRMLPLAWTRLENEGASSV